MPHCALVPSKELWVAVLCDHCRTDAKNIEVLRQYVVARLMGFLKPNLETDYSS